MGTMRNINKHFLVSADIEWLQFWTLESLTMRSLSTDEQKPLMWKQFTSTDLNVWEKTCTQAEAQPHDLSNKPSIYIRSSGWHTKSSASQVANVFRVAVWKISRLLLDNFLELFISILLSESSRSHWMSLTFSLWSINSITGHAFLPIFCGFMTCLSVDMTFIRLKIQAHLTWMVYLL